MTAAQSLLSVAALWTVAVVTPGPNFLMTSRLAVAESRRSALWAVLGIGVGTAIWGCAGFFGVQVVFVVAPLAFVALKMLGGAYLVYLGGRLIWATRMGADPAGLRVAASRTRGAAFRLGLLTNMANPKSALFVASVFATSLPLDASLGLGAASVVLMVCLSLAWYAILVSIITTRPVAAAFARGRYWLDRVAGVIFVVFGARLLLRTS